MNSDAPGTLRLTTDGTAYVYDFSFFDQWADPLEVDGRSVNGTGTWRLLGDQIAVAVQDEKSRTFELKLFVMNAPFRGTFLKAIVGDPDAPRFEQEFRRDQE